MIDLLKTFQRRLSNLSGNNKSLVHLRLRKSQDIDVHEFDFEEKLSSHQLIEALVKRKKNIKLCSILDPRDKNSNSLSKQLNNISRTDKFYFEENGSKNLYLGWPYVAGKISNDLTVRCPLLFFPIELSKSSTHWELSLKTEEAINFNKTFILAYSFYNQVTIPDEVLEYNFDELFGDIQEFKNKLYNFIQDHEFKINFNQELYNEQLIPFIDYKKDDLNHQQGIGELKLSSNAVLGIFPQADSYIIPDYDFLISNNKHQSLEEFFLSKSFHTLSKEPTNNPYTANHRIPEAEVLAPYRMDTSQEEALLAIKKGASIVVQGPPGTGKSQLICNLIIDYIGRGKRVLVVSQKRAALDVIFNRLREKDFHTFTALVHDFKSDRNVVYNKITKQVNRLEEYKQQNNAIDSIEIERKYAQVSKKIDHISEELKEFKHALFDTTEFGKSIKELYLIANLNAPHIKLNHEYRNFEFNSIEDTLSKFQFYLNLFTRFEATTHPLKDRNSFAQFSFSDSQAIKAILENFIDKITLLSTKCITLINHQFSVSEMVWIYSQKENLTTWLTLLKSKKSYSTFQELFNKKTDYEWLLGKEKNIKECFTDNIGIETSVPKEDLGKNVEYLEEYDQAGKNFFSATKYKLFNKNRVTLQRTFVQNNLDFDRTGVKKLKRKIDNRLNFEHFVSELKDKTWLLNVPDSTDLKEFEKWFHHQFVALEAQHTMQNFRSLSQYLNLTSSTYNDLETKVKQLLELGQEADNCLSEWKQYFTLGQINKLEQSDEFVKEILHCLPKDFDALCEYDKLKKTITPIEQMAFDKLTAQTLSYEEASSLFKNSLYITWIEHIEAKYPVLTIPSSGKLENTEKELQNAIKEKRELSKQIAHINLKENTYKKIAFNRLNNRITYRELEHQASKKRMVWPIRKIIDQHTNELYDLLPCWLASPETVSAVFPMQKSFDLIIFDEASQCFTEKGIPAIARANQVVVAGDSQQLAPYDLYQSRYEIEDEQESNHEKETDSLLDIADKYLSPFMLKGHYRSKTLDLIDFSNQHFYDNSLSLVQNKIDTNNYSPAISFNHIQNGTWENNTNTNEANAVVTKVLDYISKGETDLGVIAFNYKQQQLITDLLEEKALSKGINLSDSLFIKNIENIQGDERKIIILAMTYAPTPSGKISMNFGSLNRYKGENRLNVAITRAQEKIDVFCSLLPHQFDVEKSTHRGPKLLKEYINYCITVANKEWLPSPQKHIVFSQKNSLKDKLLKLDTEYVTLKKSYPFCDLVASNKTHEFGALLTDDDTYYQSTSIKEYHAYHPLFLKQKGWKINKVHSRDFFLNKEDLSLRLNKFGIRNEETI